MAFQIRRTNFRVQNSENSSAPKIFTHFLNNDTTFRQNKPINFFNNSYKNKTRRKRHVKASSSHQWSVVEVSARSEGEVGTNELFCYGVNEIGHQLQPCKFTIKVGIAPPPLSSCRLLNITSSSLSVTCDKPDTSVAGASIYRAEVYLESGELLANVTSSWPSFRVNELDPATTYSIKVYVSTGPSTSVPILVSALTSSTSPTYAVEETGPQPPPPPSAASISAATGLHLLGWSAGGVAILVIASQVYCRGRRKRHSAHHR
ncbi:uncharacterized protein LOC125179490, partial [Hyalella azteca]|uniref:Uncharacterized protein LOC125179490 n=1 Tax=Hyalella azteca TaxID=294128 RepID=A0A979FW00_HYAAZ